MEWCIPNIVSLSKIILIRNIYFIFYFVHIGSREPHIDIPIVT